MICLKAEITLNDLIDNFNRDLLKLDFINITLKKSNKNGEKYIENLDIKYRILENKGRIKVIFLVLNSKELENYLDEENFEISDIILDIYYGENDIDYYFDKNTSEIINLDDYIQRVNLLNISNTTKFSLEETFSNFDFYIKDIKNTFCIKKNNIINLTKNYISELNTTFLFKKDENMNYLNVLNHDLFDKYKRFSLYIYDKNISCIAPKDLDYFHIKLGDFINIKFSDSDTLLNINTNFLVQDENYYSLDRIINTNVFRNGKVKSIKLGDFYLDENKHVIFEINIKFLNYFFI